MLGRGCRPGLYHRARDISGGTKVTPRYDLPVADRIDRLPGLPDRLVLLGARLVPWLMLAGLGFGAGMFLRIPFASIGCTVAFLAAAVLSASAAARAGGTTVLDAWQSSRGWTADEFDLRWASNDHGRRRLEQVTTVAASHGYEPRGEPAELGGTRKLRLTRFVRST